MNNKQILSIRYLSGVPIEADLDVIHPLYCEHNPTEKHESDHVPDSLWSIFMYGRLQGIVYFQGLESHHMSQHPLVVGQLITTTCTLY